MDSGLTLGQTQFTDLVFHQKLSLQRYRIERKNLANHTNLVILQFIEKFQEVKEATRLESAKKGTANGSAFPTTPVTSANASPITGRLSGGQRGNGDALVGGTDPGEIIEPPDVSVINAPPPVVKEDLDKNSHVRTQSLTGLQV